MFKRHNPLPLIIVILVILIILGIIAFFIVINITPSSSPTNNTTTNTTPTTPSLQAEYDKNNAITQKAIDQKNPSLCDTITGGTQITYPVSGGFHTSTFDKDESIRRCKDQAAHGSSYVY